MKANASESELSQVNDEVVVGQNADFENKWWKFQVGSWAALVLLMIVTVLGALGRGHLAKCKAQTGDGSLWVEYDKVVHFRTPAEITVRLQNNAIENGVVRLRINDALYKQLGLERILPQPMNQTATNDGVVLFFPVALMAREMTVHLIMQPGSVTLSSEELGIPGRSTLRIRQLVLP
jgi:hypothetical protein